MQPLYGATECGSVEIVKILTEHGADVNLPIQDVRLLMLMY